MQRRSAGELAYRLDLYSFPGYRPPRTASARRASGIGCWTCRCGPGRSRCFAVGLGSMASRFWRKSRRGSSMRLGEPLEIVTGMEETNALRSLDKDFEVRLHYLSPSK